MWIVAVVKMGALLVEMVGLTCGAVRRRRPRRGGDHDSDDPGP